MALQHFEPTYKAFVKDISAQKAVNFLSESYSKSAPLRGFKKQANILAKQFAAAKAAVGEIVIQPWGFSGIANNKPLSRGTITLNTTHPEEALVAPGARKLRYNPAEENPGPQHQTDEEIIQGGIKSGFLAPKFARPSGGCSMMPESLGGWVNEKLSVIDASITPFFPAAHLQATTYAIAEKECDIIKTRA